MGALDGKAAAVTGAGRGIGRAHVLQLAGAGAAVIVNDVDGAEAERVAGEVRERGGAAAASTADIATQAGAEQLVNECVAAFGKIDVLVANAGIARDKTFLKMTEEDFTAVWRVHVMGTFFPCQAAAKQMIAQGTGGALVTTTSAAHFGNFGQTNYAAAKGAIASMTYTMALELARHGIRVNAISPAGTTRLSATYKGPDGKERPMPFIDPELNGPMLVYLASDEGNYISGQVFGTGADRLMLLAQPQYAHGLVKPGGWTLEDIRKHFRSNLGNRLEPLGIQKRPYPWYDGIQPPAKASES
ncbi:MAG: SDR family NAD(P)-dependent oxidoreductase [bacterium]